MENNLEIELGVWVLNEDVKTKSNLHVMEKGEKITSLRASQGNGLGLVGEGLESGKG